MTQTGSRARSDARGFNLLELMIATTMALVMVGGAAAFGVSLQRQASLQEQVMAAQDTSRAFKELLGGSVQRAGAGMGAARIQFGSAGVIDDYRYPIMVRSNADYGGTFRLAASPYLGDAFVSDAIELSWGDAGALTELVACSGGASTRVFDGANLCTRKRPTVPDALANALSRSPESPLPTFFTNPVSGLTCLRRLSALPTDQSAQTVDWTPANPSGNDCGLATGGFWNVTTNGSSSLFALPARGASFRVNWANANQPTLEMDPDGPAGDLPWQELTREVERLKVRFGVGDPANANAALVWYPREGQATPTLDSCDATCPVPGGMSAQRGDLATADPALNTRDALYRRVRQVELEITTRTTRKDVEAEAKDETGTYLLDAEGRPRDGYKRRKILVRVSPRNLALNGVSL
ncbi:MAG: PilW family protein [Myxococcaceae bacterium]